MSFIRTDFSPVGAQARAGVVPQVFAYISSDLLETIKMSDYFPIDSTTPKLNMLGVFKSNDWIMVTHGIGFSFSIIFIDNDGSDGNPITTKSDEINAA